MEGFWFIATVGLMLAGLIGSVSPVIPGTTIILAAALMHRLAVGADGSISWSAMSALVLLTLISYGVDVAAGYLGARKFGATKWGAIGGMIGAVLGLFFGLIGLFVGPVIGAIAGEIIGGKKLITAGRAGWGTFVGAIAGIVTKLFLGLIMIAIFLMNVPAPL